MAHVKKTQLQRSRAGDFETCPQPPPMPSRSLHVAVIGAGAAGLVAARELRREGHAPVVFERAAGVGGTWLYDDGAPADGPLAAGGVHSSLYASLRTNIPRECMGFLDFPFIADEAAGGDQRRYPGHEEVLRYLQEFARRFDLHKLIRLRTEVVRVRRDDACAASWRVSYCSRKLAGAGREELVVDEEEVFDAVVVCNGHFTEPRLADIAGIDGWPGKQMHSHSYRVPDPFHDQEIKRKRPVSRAELYQIVHTNKKGEPVDTYSATKMDAIKKEFDSNPELVAEEHKQGDLYSRIFPESRRHRMHGMGLMIGGKTSHLLEKVLVENLELKEMIQTMAATQKALIIRSQAMEEKIEGILSQQQANTQSNADIHDKDDGAVNHTQRFSVGTSQGAKKPEDTVKSTTKKEEQEALIPVKKLVSGTEKQMKSDVPEASQTLLEMQSVAETKRRQRRKKLDEILQQDEIKEEAKSIVHDVADSKKMQSQEIHKVKLEKVQGNTAARLKCKLENEKEVHTIKRGMEVSLRSPNGMELVASATVTNVDDKALGQDYVEVLVNYVMKKTTVLPRAQGRIKKMANAQATCIHWPRIHINLVTESENVHQRIWKGHDKEIERIKSDGVVGILDKKQKKISSTYMFQTDRVTAVKDEKKRKVEVTSGQ